jgi:hypothetical protein
MRERRSWREEILGISLAAERSSAQRHRQRQTRAAGVQRLNASNVCRSKRVPNALDPRRRRPTPLFYDAKCGARHEAGLPAGRWRGEETVVANCQFAPIEATREGEVIRTGVTRAGETTRPCNKQRARVCAAVRLCGSHTAPRATPTLTMVKTPPGGRSGLARRKAQPR